MEEDGRIELGTASLNNGKTRRHGIRPCVWVNLENADTYLTIPTERKKNGLLMPKATILQSVHGK